MPTLKILRGIPGSGKSTFAELQIAANVVIASRDRVRYAIYNNAEHFLNEDLITDVERNIVTSALNRGSDVIVDDTNVKDEYVRNFIALGHLCGATVIVQTFPVTTKEAIARNILRGNAGGRKVPDSVIYNMQASLAKTLILDGVQ